MPCLRAVIAWLYDREAGRGIQFKKEITISYFMLFRFLVLLVA